MRKLLRESFPNSHVGRAAFSLLAECNLEKAAGGKVL